MTLKDTEQPWRIEYFLDEREYLRCDNLTSVAGGLEIEAKQIIAPSFSRLFPLALPAQLNAGGNLKLYLIYVR